MLHIILYFNVWLKSINWKRLARSGFVGSLVEVEIVGIQGLI